VPLIFYLKKLLVILLGLVRDYP